MPIATRFGREEMRHGMVLDSRLRIVNPFRAAS
jgi:predicted nucleic acid-binding protein